MDNQDPSISVIGRAEWSAAPNLMSAELGVAVTRARIQEAWSIVSARINEVIASLRELGISDDDVITRHLGANVEHDYSGDTPKLSGYRVEHLLAVTVRDVTNGPNVVEAAMVVAGDLGVLNGLSFGHDRPGELIDRARQRAWADAQQKASQLASLAGVRLGAPLSVEELEGNVGPRQGVMVAMADTAAKGMPIASGQVAGAISLSVRFALQR
jgi:uncharacterized protein